MKVYSSNPLDVRTFRVGADLSSHIADTNNPHNVTKAQVGLGNVDNTADVDKPISTATQTALDDKLETSDITGKLDKNGYTGNIQVVTSVDFTNETVTTKTISYTDGQITDVS